MTRSIFSQNTSHSSPIRVRYGMYFVVYKIRELSDKLGLDWRQINIDLRVFCYLRYFIGHIVTSHENTYGGILEDVMTWKHFCITGPLWGESIGHQWISSQQANNMELWCFFLRLRETIISKYCWVVCDLRCYNAHIMSLTIMKTKSHEQWVIRVNLAR